MPSAPWTSLPTSTAPRPTYLGRLRGLTCLLDPAALFSIVRAIISTRSRLYLRTGSPLPGIAQIVLALRFWSEKEDRRRLDEARDAREAAGGSGTHTGVARTHSNDLRDNVNNDNTHEEGNAPEEREREGHQPKRVQEVAVTTVTREARNELRTNSNGRRRRRRRVVDLSMKREEESMETCEESEAQRTSPRLARDEGGSVAALQQQMNRGEADSQEYDGLSAGGNVAFSDGPSISREELRNSRYIVGGNNDVYLRKARHLCLVSTAAYASSNEQLKSEYLPSINPEVLLVSKWNAEKFSPAYFVYYDDALDAIVVSVRGTKDIPDMITNLSVDTLPFSPHYCLEGTVGYGHAGVIRSAKKLLEELSPVLRSAVGPTYSRPQCIPECYTDKKIILTGHSLGGAVASILSLLLSCRTLPNTECVVFCAPPCLSPGAVAQPRGGDITMIMYGLDLVPRISVGSLERLLTKALQYDWRRHAGANAETWIRSFFGNGTSGDSENGNETGTAATSDNSQSRVVGMIGNAVRNYGVDGVVWALDGVRNVATRSLSVDAAPAGRTGPAVAWGAARAATAFVAGLLASQLRSPETPRAASWAWEPVGASGYARAFGISDDALEETLRTSGRHQVKELSVLGRILHIERDLVGGEVQLKEVMASDLRDIEASLCMVYDHEPERVIEAIAMLLGEVQVSAAT